MQTSRRRRPFIAAGAALALLIGLSGCSGASPAPFSEHFSVLAGLEEIPAAALDGWTMISVADVAALREISGSTDESFPADISGIVPREDGSYGPIVLALPSLLQSTMLAPGERGEATLEQVGFSMWTIDRYTSVEALPSSFVAVSGGVDENTLPDALSDISEGVVSLGEGEDFTTNVNDGNDFSRIGQPIRLSEKDGVIAISLSTPLVESWFAGSGTTAASDESLARLASVLDEESVVSAVIAPSRPGTFLAEAESALRNAGDPAEAVRALEESMIPEPFSHAGIGWRGTTDQPEIVVVYLFADDGAAKDARPAVETLYSDGSEFNTSPAFSTYFTVEDTTQRGDTVVVTLTPEAPPVTILQMLHQGGLLFASR